MFKRPTNEDSSIKGNAALIEIDKSNEKWREIGRIYQFLSVPFQCFILSVTMVLSYFSLLSLTEVYVSIGLLILVFLFLLASLSTVKGKLVPNEKVSERVLKMYKQGIRTSISFPIIIYVVCGI